MKRFTLFAVLAIAFCGNAAAGGQTYKIDPSHTNVLASWNHKGYSNPTASFGGVDGTLEYDATAPEKSRVDVRIPLSGLNSFTPIFDEHLRGERFFDAAKYPVITFTSTAVHVLGADALHVVGDLTIKGVTRQVMLDTKLNKAGQGRDGSSLIGFDATTTIKRSEFGIDAAVPAVSDEIAIRITTEASAAN